MSTTTTKPNFQNLYEKTIAPALKEKFAYKNVMQTPKLSKIVINMGLGEAKDDPKIIEEAREQLAMMTGQMPKITRTRKAVSNFKIRKDLAIGCAVTLRKKMMYEFLERFVCVACPRIRDFRGFSPRQFDGAGNYNVGLTDQTIFPDINLDKVKRSLGMNITVVTTATTDAEAMELLKGFGFPFRK